MHCSCVEKEKARHWPQFFFKDCPRCCFAEISTLVTSCQVGVLWEWPFRKGGLGEWPLRVGVLKSVFKMVTF
jgi:hypothetical protein